MATETLPDETRPLLQTRAAVEVTGQTATEDELFAEWQHVKWWKRPSVYTCPTVSWSCVRIAC